MVVSWTCQYCTTIGAVYPPSLSLITPKTSSNNSEPSQPTTASNFLRLNLLIVSWSTYTNLYGKMVYDSPLPLVGFDFWISASLTTLFLVIPYLVYWFFHRQVLTTFERHIQGTTGARLLFVNYIRSFDTFFHNSQTGISVSMVVLWTCRYCIIVVAVYLLSLNLITAKSSSNNS